MSQENLEVVRGLYRAMETRNFDAITKVAHPDAEWISDWRVGESPIRGLENVIRFFDDQAEMFADLRAEPERLWETEDRVLVFIHVTGRGRASDAPFDIRIAHLGRSRTALSCGVRASLSGTRLSKRPAGRSR